MRGRRPGENPIHARYNLPPEDLQILDRLERMGGMFGNRIAGIVNADRQMVVRLHDFQVQKERMQRIDRTHEDRVTFVDRADRLALGVEGAARDRRNVSPEEQAALLGEAHALRRRLLAIRNDFMGRDGFRRQACGMLGIVPVRALTTQEVQLLMYQIANGDIRRPPRLVGQLYDIERVRTMLDNQLLSFGLTIRKDQYIQEIMTARDGAANEIGYELFLQEFLQPQVVTSPTEDMFGELYAGASAGAMGDYPLVGTIANPARPTGSTRHLDYLLAVEDGGGYGVGLRFNTHDTMRGMIDAAEASADPEVRNAVDTDFSMSLRELMETTLENVYTRFRTAVTILAPEGFEIDVPMDAGATLLDGENHFLMTIRRGGVSITGQVVFDRATRSLRLLVPQNLANAGTRTIGYRSYPLSEEGLETWDPTVSLLPMANFSSVLRQAIDELETDVSVERSALEALEYRHGDGAFVDPRVVLRGSPYTLGQLTAELRDAVNASLSPSAVQRDTISYTFVDFRPNQSEATIQVSFPLRDGGEEVFRMRVAASGTSISSSSGFSHSGSGAPEDVFQRALELRFNQTSLAPDERTHLNQLFGRTIHVDGKPISLPPISLDTMTVRFSEKYTGEVIRQHTARDLAERFILRVYHLPGGEYLADYPLSSLPQLTRDFYGQVASDLSENTAPISASRAVRSKDLLEAHRATLAPDANERIAQLCRVDLPAPLNYFSIRTEEIHRIQGKRTINGVPCVPIHVPLQQGTPLAPNGTDLGWTLYFDEQSGQLHYAGQSGPRMGRAYTFDGVVPQLAMNMDVVTAMTEDLRAMSALNLSTGKLSTFLDSLRGHPHVTVGPVIGNRVTLSYRGILDREVSILPAKDGYTVYLGYGAGAKRVGGTEARNVAIDKFLNEFEKFYTEEVSKEVVGAANAAANLAAIENIQGFLGVVVDGIEIEHTESMSLTTSLFNQIRGVIPTGTPERLTFRWDAKNSRVLIQITKNSSEVYELPTNPLTPPSDEIFIKLGDTDYSIGRVRENAGDPELYFPGALPADLPKELANELIKQEGLDTKVLSTLRSLLKNDGVDIEYDISTRQLRVLTFLGQAIPSPVTGSLELDSDKKVHVRIAGVPYELDNTAAIREALHSEMRDGSQELLEKVTDNLTSQCISLRRDGMICLDSDSPDGFLGKTFTYRLDTSYLEVDGNTYDLEAYGITDKDVKSLSLSLSFSAGKFYMEGLGPKREISLNSDFTVNLSSIESMLRARQKALQNIPVNEHKIRNQVVSKIIDGTKLWDKDIEFIDFEADLFDNIGRFTLKKATTPDSSLTGKAKKSAENRIKKLKKVPDTDFIVFNGPSGLQVVSTVWTTKTGEPLMVLRDGALTSEAKAYIDNKLK